MWNGCESKQDLQQVWFARAHADVGGGYPEDSYSNVALDWMAREARQNCLKLNALPAPVPPCKPPHHEVMGLFSVTHPVCRQALLDPNPLALQSYQFHESTRAWLDDPLRYGRDSRKCRYPYRRGFPFIRIYPEDVMSVFRQVDDITAMLHMSLPSQHIGVAPGSSRLILGLDVITAAREGALELLNSNGLTDLPVEDGAWLLGVYAVWKGRAGFEDMSIIINSRNNQAAASLRGTRADAIAAHDDWVLRLGALRDITVRLTEIVPAGRYAEAHAIAEHVEISFEMFNESAAKAIYTREG